MSKPNTKGGPTARPRAARAARALMIFAVLASSSPARAQAPAAAAGSKSAVVAATTDEVLRETSEIRRLAVLRPVKSGAQSRAEIERMLVRNLGEKTTPEKMRAGELASKKFGLLPADFQLRAFVVSLLTEQILGYYDPKTQHFYLADWIDVEGQRPVMAHELAHALQDQHFDLLRRFDGWPEGDSDAELAAHALVEGDASLVMMFYALRDMKRAAATFKSAAAPTPQLDRAPRALRASLMFPYEQGLEFASNLYKRGGWDEVSAAYRRLPESTEQLLHPEKYFARETPVRVELPSLAPALGAPWRRISSNVNGEWGYFLVLNEFLGDEKLARAAAAGWGGDRYALYENPRTRQTLLAHVSAWDTEAEAVEFFDAYARRTEARYKNAAALTPAPATPASASKAWRTAGGTVIAERRGARVAVLEGVPPKAQTAALLQALQP
ncbi:MAG: hypothetical protein LC800_08560 [Acidobacteria bacterium]|nr:hypothetical protein [Acidobacteriota bacterium]